MISAFNKRSLINATFVVLCKAAAVICVLLVVVFIARIAWNGSQAFSLNFLLTPAKNFGVEGGVFYQIIGTLLLVFFVALITLPIALGTAIFQCEYITSVRFDNAFKIIIYGLNSIPSVIFGIFGLIFFLNILDTGISWFVGSMILSMMVLPTVVLSTYQSISTIPSIYRESALALGFTKIDVIVKVLVPQGIGGAITGLLLGMARAAGETAPIMFIATAFSGVTVPQSFFEPVLALPTHILALSQQATNAQAIDNAWGASLVLLMIVMVLNISAFFLRLKFKRVSQR